MTTGNSQVWLSVKSIITELLTPRLLKTDVQVLYVQVLSCIETRLTEGEHLSAKLRKTFTRKKQTVKVI